MAMWLVLELRYFYVCMFVCYWLEQLIYNCIYSGSRGGVFRFIFQIAPQDQDVPAVIRVTSTVSETAVNCTVTLQYIFALTSR